MKKTLIALAALGAMAGAHAQSTVTLYGLLDGNIQSFKTNILVPASATVPGSVATIQSARQTRIESGGLNGSRWGLRVSEDIGGGMAIVGNLESGLNLDTGASGQGGLLFGRRANAGISSSSFGTLVIGRNSSSYDDVSADHAMMGATIFDPSNTNNGNSTTNAAAISAAGGLTTSPAGAVAFLNRNTAWVGFNTRFNNSVKYTTPNFSGFSASGMYAFGEDKVPGVKASESVSANLKYANGPILVSGGYQSEALARTATTKPALENVLLNAAYDFGVAKVGAGFNRAKYKDVVAPASLGGGNIASQNEISLSVAVPLGATTLSAGVARSKGDTLGKSTGFGVQALYSLSKRSTLYAGAQTTKGYDKLIASLPAGSNVDKITTYGVGLRHTF
ncbi:porin [Polaromonas sp.]|uniref:porin n=1 Tax=Polaromonas sp. TaxID=1869339 RepID=UPI00183F84BD|nr:porin [Polaromonas sp.]NMM08261.1 porin [Polaromonas sp.]